MDNKLNPLELNPKLQQSISSKNYKWIFIFIVFLILILLSTGTYYFILPKLNQELTAKTSLRSIKPLPIPAPIFNLKTYTNTKYGFTFDYPAKGITQKGNVFPEVECGNAVKEVGNDILVDNLFKIQIIDSPKTLDDYLISKGAKKTYEFEKLLNTNADEALKVLGIKKGLELVSIGYPSLMNINAIYKKGNRLFLIINFENPSNEGCINPKELDHTKFQKYINQNWDVLKSFKFTQ